MSLLRDIRYGARVLGRSPIFTAVAVVSLALGIGAGTSIFSLVNAILLRSLPVPNPHELRVIKWSGADWESWQEKIAADTGRDRFNRWVSHFVSIGGFHALREQCAAQANIFGFCPIPGGSAFRARHEPIWTQGLLVSGNFFSGLGVRPLIGRLLGMNDEGAGAAPAVVISYRCWEEEFGLDPDIAGQSITVGAFSFTVVGVLPREFPGVEPGASAYFYVSLSAQLQLSPMLTRGDPDVWWVRPIARLRPGVSDAQFQAALQVLFTRQADAIKMKEPKIWTKSGRAGPGEERDKYEGSLVLLFWVVGVVLLVACANLAGLMLARGAARQHEFAVRAALGAARLRLVRQSLTESVLVALLGGGSGLMIAIWGKTAIGRLLADSPDGLHYNVSLDLKVLAFTLAVSLATALLSGLLPALREARVDPMASLKDQAVLGAPRLRVARFLVTAQIALSLLLVAVAGLFVRTLVNLAHVNNGFTIDHILVFGLRPDNIGYHRSQIPAFFDNALESLAALPGVRSAAFVVHRPLTYQGSSRPYKIQGDKSGSGFNARACRSIVSESFFKTLGLPLVLGRELRATDNAGAPRVAVVNEMFVRKYLAGRNPIGVIISEEENGGDWEIVGVCRDANYRHIKEDLRPIVHFSFHQRPAPLVSFILRTTLPPLALIGPARQAVAAVDPRVPLNDISTLEQIRDTSFREQRTIATLCGSLAVLALALSCIGIYGLMAYQVTRRTGEIGIRLALGATRWQIAGPILREAVALACIGIVLGMPLTLALVHGLYSPANTFYGVGPSDPLTFCGAATLFLGVGLIGAWIPARRAAGVDPMVALRSEWSV